MKNYFFVLNCYCRNWDKKTTMSANGYCFVWMFWCFLGWDKESTSERSAHPIYKFFQSFENSSKILRFICESNMDKSLVQSEFWVRLWEVNVISL